MSFFFWLLDGSYIWIPFHKLCDWISLFNRNQLQFWLAVRVTSSATTLLRSAYSLTHNPITYSYSSRVITWSCTWMFNSWIQRSDFHTTCTCSISYYQPLRVIISRIFWIPVLIKVRIGSIHFTRIPRSLVRDGLMFDPTRREGTYMYLPTDRITC